MRVLKEIGHRSSENSVGSRGGKGANVSKEGAMKERGRKESVLNKEEVGHHFLAAQPLDFRIRSTLVSSLIYLI